MSFRIWAFLYVIALVASAVATFGVHGGAILATLILAFWLSMFWAPRATLMVIGSIIFLLAIVWLAGYIATRGMCAIPEWPPARRCQENLRWQARSILQHDTSTRRLPGPYLTSRSIKPLLSWRVRLLQYMDQNDLYEKFDLQQAWDSPANLPHSSQIIDSFYCIEDYSAPLSSTAHYLAVVGDHAVWRPNVRGSLGAIKDELSQTILLIEKRNSAIQWAEPGDLSFDEAADLLSSPLQADEGHRVDNGFFYKPFLGRNVAFANCSVMLLPAPLDRELAEALLTADGGEEIDPEILQRLMQPRLDYEKCFTFTIFVFLSVLPVYRVYQHADSQLRKELPADDTGGSSE